MAFLGSLKNSLFLKYENFAVVYKPEEMKMRLGTEEESPFTQRYD